VPTDASCLDPVTAQNSIITSQQDMVHDWFLHKWKMSWSCPIIIIESQDGFADGSARTPTSRAQEFTKKGFLVREKFWCHCLNYDAQSSLGDSSPLLCKVLENFEWKALIINMISIKVWKPRMLRVQHPLLKPKLLDWHGQCPRTSSPNSWDG
jgi:hypothetical protein